MMLRFTRTRNNRKLINSIYMRFNSIVYLHGVASSNCVLCRKLWNIKHAPACTRSDPSWKVGMVRMVDWWPPNLFRYIESRNYHYLLYRHKWNSIGMTLACTVWELSIVWETESTFKHHNGLAFHFLQIRMTRIRSSNWSKNFIKITRTFPPTMYFLCLFYYIFIFRSIGSRLTSSWCIIEILRLHFLFIIFVNVFDSGSKLGSPMIWRNGEERQCSTLTKKKKKRISRFFPIRFWRKHYVINK